MSAPVCSTSPVSRSWRRTSSGRPRRRGEHLERPVQAHARAAADVVDAAGRVRRRRGRAGGRDDVGDEGEVARLAPVAEQPDRRAVQRRLAEPPERHVGPLPRSVDREVAQRDGRDAVLGVVEAAQLLGGELGHAVGRERLRGARPRASAAPRRRRRPTTRTRRRSAARAGPRSPRGAAGWRRRCCARSGRSAGPSSGGRPARRRGGTRRRGPRSAARGRRGRGRRPPAGSRSDASAPSRLACLSPSS